MLPAPPLTLQAHHDALRGALNALADVDDASWHDFARSLARDALPRYRADHRTAAMQAHGQVVETTRAYRQALIAIGEAAAADRLRALQLRHYDILAAAAADDSYGTAGELTFIRDPHVRSSRAAEHTGYPRCTCDACYAYSAEGLSR